MSFALKTPSAVFGTGEGQCMHYVFLLFSRFLSSVMFDFPQIRSSSRFHEFLQCHVLDQYLIGAWKVLGP